MATATDQTLTPSIPNRSEESAETRQAIIETSKSNDLSFPQDCIVGSLGQFAREMAVGTEVPEEFYFAAALTFFGATTVGSLTTDSALKNVEPRLYTVLLGESADVKKSTALQNTSQFFKGIWAVEAPGPVIIDGVGSAEGLGLKLKDESRGAVLCYDELSSFIQKSKIESSLLLQMVSTLFERTCFENRTLNHEIKIEKGHLTLLACCTTETYDSMWTQSAIAIGFPNRLFVVWAERKHKVAWPESRDPAILEGIRGRILQQLEKLPLCLKIEEDAKSAWQKWYEQLPSSMYAKRLDSIGVRLMMIIAVTTDKLSINLVTVEIVTRILDYELRIRTITDPIDCVNTIAMLEEKIRRQLRQRGPLSKAELIRFTNARRCGLWAFDAAVKNLIGAQHIRQPRADGKWEIWHDPDGETTREESKQESPTSFGVNASGM